MATKKTKHGVLDLNHIGKPVKTMHEHRYFPQTEIARSGTQKVQMVCYCGDVEQETEMERTFRENAELDRERETDYLKQYGGSR